MNRENNINGLALELRPDFARWAYEVPEGVRQRGWNAVSCGW